MNMKTYNNSKTRRMMRDLSYPFWVRSWSSPEQVTRRFDEARRHINFLVSEFPVLEGFADESQISAGCYQAAKHPRQFPLVSSDSITSRSIGRRAHQECVDENDVAHLAFWHIYANHCDRIKMLFSAYGPSERDIAPLTSHSSWKKLQPITGVHFVSVGRGLSIWGVFDEDPTEYKITECSLLAHAMRVVDAHLIDTQRKRREELREAAELAHTKGFSYGNSTSVESLMHALVAECQPLLHSDLIDATPDHEDAVR